MVDFLIVGTPKSGTSAIHEYLRNHPEIFMPAHKEIHFFGSEFKIENNRYRKQLTETEYHETFKQAKDGQVLGESSVFYLYSDDAPSQIKAYNPNMKIIVSLRHPVDFLISYHQDSLYVEQEVESDFWKALALEKIRREGGNVPPNNNFPKTVFYSELVEYSKYVHNYFNVFGRENVKVLIFEEFFKNPQQGYQDILKFLNLNHTNFSLPQFKKINPRRSIKNKTIDTIIKRPPNFLRYFLRILFPSEKLRLSIFTKLRLLNTTHQKVNILSFKEKQELQQKYLPNIVKLEKLLNKDLSIWKNLYN